MKFALLASAGLIFLAGCKTAATGEVGSFKIGERIPVGVLIYNVIDSQWNVTLGQGPVPRVPQNRFFIVNLSIVNSGSSDQSVPTFNLVDDKGDIFPELANGEGVPLWIGIARRIRPADSLQGNIVFDVEPRHYRLKIAEETEERFAWVDIPLDFGTPPPVADQPRDAIPSGPSRR